MPPAAGVAVADVFAQQRGLTRQNGWVCGGFLDAGKNLAVNLRLTMLGPNVIMSTTPQAAESLLEFAGGRHFATILADPPWRFQNNTGKIAPEHRRLTRYATMSLDDICGLPVASIAEDTAHLYLWVPNALLPSGILVLKAWGFEYKSNLIWHKVRQDGGSDGRGVGFYFRNVTEVILFGVRGPKARTLPPGRRQVNYIAASKREHSRKPDEQYELIEACSRPRYIELFARGARNGWASWGNEAYEAYRPSWPTYGRRVPQMLAPASE